MTTVEIRGARAGQTQPRLVEDSPKCREDEPRVLLLAPATYTPHTER